MDDLSPPTRGDRAPLLVLAGALLLLASLLNANPWFGAASSSWPWEILTRGRSPITLANWIVWMGSGVVAILWGLRRGGRWRGATLAAPALVLLFTCYSGQAGLRIEENSIFVLAGLAMLLGSFLLQAGGHAPRAVVPLGAIGGLLVIWTLASTFDHSPAMLPRSRLVSDVGDLIAQLLGRDLPTARPLVAANLATVGVLLACALLGILGLLGLRNRLVGWIGALLVGATFCIRPVSRYVTLLGSEGFDGVTLARQVSEILIPLGAALCFFGAALLTDLARSSDREPA